MVFSAFGSTAPSGFIFGGLVSALAAKYQSWPWGFWFMAILEAVCGIVAIFLVPRTPTPRKETTHSLWARMDIAGCVTGISGLILFNIALNMAPGAQWQDPYIYILLIASLVFFGLFGYIERKAAFPLIPFSAITPDISFVLATLACGWAAFGVACSHQRVCCFLHNRVNPSKTACQCGHDDLCSGLLHSRHSLCHHAYQTELLGAAICVDNSDALGHVSYFMTMFRIAVRTD
jgi:MFS family permease